MSLNLKQKPAWVQLIIFGLITILLTVMSTFVGFIVIARLQHMDVFELGKLTTLDFAKPQFAGVARALLVVQFFGIFLLPCLVFAYIADPRPLAFAGLKKPYPLSAIWLGIAIIIFSYIMVEWLGRVNEYLVNHVFGKSVRDWVEKGESDVDGTLQNILNMKSVTDLVVAILLVGVLAAVGEELFFRGILQRILIQSFRSPWLGIIVTAAIFSAIHGQFMGFIPRMVLGMILGALYWYSGSLFPAMAGHFFFNALQILLVYFKVIDPKSSAGSARFLPIMGILALAIVAVLLNYLRKRSRTTYAGIYQTAIPGPQMPLLDDD